MAKFIKNKKYYTGIVYEWNLPTGITCPFAKECKVSVDRFTGKFNIKQGAFRCYASSSERFPSVRQHRWSNYVYLINGGVPELPKDCENVRIHASGDFYSQEYFDMWVKLAIDNPNVHFWAFTKSIAYWLLSKENIPSNLVLTASYGGYQDSLIEENNLKSVRVYPSLADVPTGMPVDTNDDYARTPDVHFALLDNNKNPKKKTC